MDLVAMEKREFDRRIKLANDLAFEVSILSHGVRDDWTDKVREVQKLMLSLAFANEKRAKELGGF